MHPWLTLACALTRGPTRNLGVSGRCSNQLSCPARARWFRKCRSDLPNYWFLTKSKLHFIYLVPTNFLIAQFYFTEPHDFATKIKSIIWKTYLVFIVYLIRVTTHFIFSTNENTPQLNLLVFEEAKKNHPKVYCAVQTVEEVIAADTEHISLLHLQITITLQK